MAGEVFAISDCLVIYVMISRCLQVHLGIGLYHIIRQSIDIKLILFRIFNVYFMWLRTYVVAKLASQLGLNIFYFKR